MFYLLSRKKRRITFRNLKRVFPQYSYAELEKIARRSFINFGSNLAESFTIPKMKSDVFLRYVKMKNADFLKKEPNGHILVGIHEGSWEVFLCGISKVINYAVLARRQKNEKADALLNKARKNSGLKVCFNLRCLISYLKRKYWIGIVVDHGAQKNAPRVKFFGFSIPTPSGVHLLAKKFNKKIYAGYIRRKQGLYQEIEFSSPILPAETDEETLLKINSFFEEKIKKYPQEYIWWYKRFKRTKDLKVIVLDDGRRGHFNQAHNCANLFEELGFKVDIINVRVKYKHESLRLIADLFFWMKAFPRFAELLLKNILTQQSWQEIKNKYADVIVSAGSYTAAVNCLFSGLWGAKSIQLLKPNIPLFCFNLAVIPYHDKAIAFANTAKIIGSLTYFNKSRIDSAVAELKNKFELKEGKKLALFIGGPISNEEIYCRNLKVFLDELKGFSLRNNLKIIATTSFRSSAKIENLMEKELSNFSSTEILILANRLNYDFVVTSFLALAEYVFVSADSVSMITEALSLRKVPAVVSLEKDSNKHHKRFIDFLKEKDLLNELTAPYKIEENSLKTSTEFSVEKVNRLSIMKKMGSLGL